MGLALALALVVGGLSQPAPFLTMLELLSSSVALLATLGSEGQLETYLEVALEDCQAQIKRLQLAWQRLSLGCRWAAIWVLRVVGPVLLLLTWAFVEALCRPHAAQPPAGTEEEYWC